jgi:OLD-like protein
MTPRAVILVEGESDRIAVETLAARSSRDLAAEGVAVQAIGGAQAVRRSAEAHAGIPVGGLYDIGEERAVLRGLERAGVSSDGFFACDPDLEGELVRALGSERMLELITSRGQLGPFETYRKQPAQRAKPLEAQLHGWLHNWKVRYAAALVEAVPLDRVPRPLAGVLAWTDASRLSR